MLGDLPPLENVSTTPLTSAVPKAQARPPRWGVFNYRFIYIYIYIYNIDNICIYRLIEDSVALSFRIFVLTIVIPCQD